MQQTHGGDVPDVEHAINDDSNAMLAAVEKKIPDAWHMSCFAHLTPVSVHKHKKHLHSVVGIDDLAKDLTDIGNLVSLGILKILFQGIKKTQIAERFSKSA